MGSFHGPKPSKPYDFPEYVSPNTNLIKMCPSEATPHDSNLVAFGRILVVVVTFKSVLLN